MASAPTAGSDNTLRLDKWATRRYNVLMEEGQDQEAIDQLYAEARLETLQALRKFEGTVRDDEVMGGPGATLVNARLQHLVEKARLFRTSVNLREAPLRSTWLADSEDDKRRGMGRRRRLDPL